MSTQVSKSTFKARALEILRQIERSGEPVVITDHGRPVLIVRRYSPAVQSARERLKGSVLRYDDPFQPVGESDWDALS